MMKVYGRLTIFKHMLKHTLSFHISNIYWQCTNFLEPVALPLLSNVKWWILCCRNLQLNLHLHRLKVIQHCVFGARFALWFNTEYLISHHIANIFQRQIEFLEGRMHEKFNFQQIDDGLMGNLFWWYVSEGNK